MLNQNLMSVIDARRIIDGPTDKLRAVSTVRYPWALEMFDKMRANNWDPHEVSFVRDRVQFPELKYGQQFAYKHSVAFLSNLDSIQVDNLAENVGQIITDPNIRECIYRQQFEEVIHVKAYSAMIESVFPEDPLSVYNLYNVIDELGAKNDYIIKSSQEVSDAPTSTNKVKAIVSNIALEGIYFYNGFADIYAIGRDTGGMQGSVDQIKYIQRDETTHLRLFTDVFNALRRERPDLFTPQHLELYRKVLHDAAILEGNWGRYLIQHGVPGLNDDIATAFPQHRADECARDIGLEPIFGVDNPLPWFYEYSKINGSQKNFFETKVMTYSETKPVFPSRRRIESSQMSAHGK